MKVLNVKHTHLYDVFVGEGWENHIRVYYKNGKLSFTKCGTARLTKDEITTLQIKLSLMEVK